MRPLTFWELVREAFNHKVKLPALGGLPANKMGLGLFAVLGLANPGFWFLGAAAEIAFLVLAASSPRFRKVVEGARLLEAQQTWREKVHTAVQRLTPANRDRYRALLEQCRRTLGISETLNQDSLENLRDLRSQSLNQLLSIFLRLLTTREVIAANTQGLDRITLQAELERLQKRVETAAEGSALRRSLEGSRDILQRRLENLERATESLKVIDAELERIEGQVELMREESAVGGRPDYLSSRLDAVTATMSETSQWIEQHSDFFHSLAGDEVESILSLPPEMPVEERPVEVEKE